MGISYEFYEPVSPVELRSAAIAFGPEAAFVEPASERFGVTRGSPDVREPDLP
ncbi:hypothetical protein [Yimella sp. RIT 621]|uniref:hypothetical protein n=1 Tax=Yimella sp. RIT 621 TaxID=2510323 RepID=UPI00145A0041|nr:hypothetical protein [Yimella sp. RIT 621]